MFWRGTTTVEVKSGYGLNVADELRMLEVGRQLGRAGPVDVVNTFLGAHDFPPGMSARPLHRHRHRRDDPRGRRAAAWPSSATCTSTTGYYTVAESRRILERARDAGLRLKVHTDAYSDIGGAYLAAELGVVSADHLNYTTPQAARALAAGGRGRRRHARARLGRGPHAGRSTRGC